MDDDVAATDVYVVELRRTRLWYRAGCWVLALVSEGSHPIAHWSHEAVVSDRRSRRKIAVIRNELGPTSDRVTAASEDVDEMNASSFASLYL